MCGQGTCNYQPQPGPGCAQPCQNASECDDGDPCTLDDCMGGVCDFAPDDECGNPGGGKPCKSDVDCADGNPCTYDLCGFGQCFPVQIPNCGQPCAGDMSCNDNEPCTIDSCINGACKYQVDPSNCSP
jgi:hypothetical protein